ncbi:MAG: photosynthetic complex putative assembly protein PuhB [Pseudomonadota bacterium]
MPKDEFTVEPIEGLPERPPSGELILWQGRPSKLALARDALGLYWVAGYFVLLALWRIGVSSASMPVSEALPLGLPFIILGAATCLVLFAIAWVLASTTVYTITTARVAMRIGAALTVTLNLPFSRILSADLAVGSDGSGTVVFQTAGDVRLSYLVLWPHVRPWHVRLTCPALRSIPDAANVAKIFAEAAETRIGQPEIEARDFDAVAAQ